jgi:hypothetical protein
MNVIQVDTKPTLIAAAKEDNFNKLKLLNVPAIKNLGNSYEP